MKRLISFFGPLFFFAMFIIKLDYFDRYTEPKECSFCSNELVMSQKIYEDDTLICLIPCSPIMKGHIVIAPKRHVENLEELTNEEFIHIHQILKPLNEKVKELYTTDSYVLIENNGFNHAHLHFIPMKKGECHPFFKFGVRTRSLTDPFYDTAERAGTQVEVAGLRRALNGLKEG